MREVLVISLITLLLISCSEKTIEVGKNDPPRITFTFDKLAVGAGRTQTLTVDATDPDGDPVSVTWAATGGTLEPQDQGKTSMRWTAPVAVGEVDTITAVASDGTESRSAALVLETGTYWDTSIMGGTTTWTAANSPYIVGGFPDSRLVISAATLIIRAGVRVYIDDQDLIIDVAGGRMPAALRITGSASARVVIRPNRRSPSAGFWQGIRGDPSNVTLDIAHAQISHAFNNLRADEFSDLLLSDSKIMHALKEGIIFRSEGRLEVRNSNISENKGSGILVERISGAPDTVKILDSAIRFNGGSGIEISLADSAGEFSYVEVGRDTIAYNDFHGVNILFGAFPKIHNCAIFNNDFLRVNNGFGVRIDPGFRGEKTTVDARNNFWGAAIALDDSILIDRMIYDIKDNSGLPRVRYVPWCNDHPVCTPPTVGPKGDGAVGYRATRSGRPAG